LAYSGYEVVKWWSGEVVKLGAWGLRLAALTLEFGI
jgi:hypothetical protein